ncbi:uncharacterized protein STEHIDRAFT_173146 [Stereum hirsutum FP-91666 SS1]|uniref:Uncharacterized protein n=1 Tax=Stereum hirsutum (strain FP-91666) TaxID=721885 RepID=R7RX29_STEHR|nr:uncharacterized protein STEHIDRAFT_173146 [Stereum hirsutum FP-91666 SS1]EIM79410.1 hypothetical protein STEHIDRAFT_173146 [Stereum hirsutum FP-91666 SS1]
MKRNADEDKHLKWGTWMDIVFRFIARYRPSQARAVRCSLPSAIPLLFLRNWTGPHVGRQGVMVGTWAQVSVGLRLRSS